MKSELKKIQEVLTPDDLKGLMSQCKDGNLLQGEHEEPSESSREAFVKITLDFLKIMKQKEFAECLLRSENISLNIYGASKGNFYSV